MLIGQYQSSDRVSVECVSSTASHQSVSSEYVDGCHVVDLAGTHGFPWSLVNHSTKHLLLTGSTSKILYSISFSHLISDRLTLPSKSLNISFNLLTHLDASFFASNPACLQHLTILDLHDNFLVQFPSSFLTQLGHLQTLAMQSNFLTSFDLSLLVLVSGSVNLAQNRISKITNDANVDLSLYTNPSLVQIDLTNNSAVIDVTDAIYVMYGVCVEIQQLFRNSTLPSSPLILTIGFLRLNFASSRLNCSCDQFYLQRALRSILNNQSNPAYPGSQVMCTDGSLFLENNRTLGCPSSTVNFSSTSPRLCKITANETGVVPVNSTGNTLTSNATGVSGVNWKCAEISIL